MTTMTKIAELKAKQAALAKELADETARAREDAIKRIKTEIRELGITAGHLGFRTEAPDAPRPARTPRYRDTDSDKTWDGRGHLPAWIKDKIAAGKAKSKDDFLIDKPAAAPAASAVKPSAAPAAATVKPAPAAPVPGLNRPAPVTK